MTNKVGSKGQVVIEKEIRDELGIEPGWTTIQQIVDGRLQILFVPPEHDRSQLAALREYANPTVDDSSQESWDRIEDVVSETIARDAWKDSERG